MALRDRIRELRKNRGLSQERLARQADLSLNLIGRLEGGQVTDPHYSTLRGLAQALGVPLEELLEPEEKRSARDIARAAGRREREKTLKAVRRTIASEGIDPATRISDVHEPAAYDDLLRQGPKELAGALVDAEQDVVRLEHAIAQLERENAQLRADAERESVRR